MKSQESETSEGTELCESVNFEIVMCVFKYGEMSSDGPLCERLVMESQASYEERLNIIL